MKQVIEQGRSEWGKDMNICRYPPWPINLSCSGSRNSSWPTWKPSLEFHPDTLHEPRPTV